jgi:hypothetical protein
MATIGSLIVSLIAETSLFDSGLRKSQTGLKGFVSDISKTQQSMMNFARGAMAAAGIAGLGYLAKQTMESIEKTSHLSDRLGMTTEDLISLQYAARQTGMGTEEMNNVLEIFVRKIGEASAGSGSATKTLRDLGLSAQELAFKDPAESLKLVADRINQLPNAAERGAAAFDLFGRKSKDILDLLAEGSTGIEAMRKRAEQLGITFSKLDAAQVTEANKKLRDVKDVMTGIAQTAMIEMAPSIAAAAEQIVTLVTSIQDMRGGIIASIKDVTMGFAYFANGVVVVIASVKGLVAIFTLWGTIVADVLAALGVVPKAFADEMALTADRMLNEVKASVEKLPSEKVNAWFATLEKNSARIKEEIEKAATAAGTFPKITVADIKTTDSLQKMLDALEFEYDMLKKTNKERRTANELLRFRNEIDKAYNVKLSGNLQGVGPQMQGWEKLNAVQQKAILLDQQYEEMQKKIEARANGPDQFTTKIKEWGEDATNIWANLGDIATNALDGISKSLTDMIMSGKANFADLAKSIIADLIQMTIRAQIYQMIMMATGMFAGASAGPGSPGVGTQGPTGMGFARGGIFAAGNVIPFAAGGGIVNRKVLFPMANGNVGMMGEAGPEAIMPLTRGPGGRLGVAANGGGRTINMTINTPNADSFRRSKSQIMAEMKRHGG